MVTGGSWQTTEGRLRVLVRSVSMGVSERLRLATAEAYAPLSLAKVHGWQRAHSWNSASHRSAAR